MAPTKYMKQHKVVSYLRWLICSGLDEQVPQKMIQTPETIVSISDTAAMWDMAVLPDQTVLENHPYLVTDFKGEKQCLLIDYHS